MYRQQDAGAGAGPQHFLSATTPSSSFSQTTFPSPLFSLDPSLQSSPQHLQPAGTHGLSRPSSSDRRPSNVSQAPMQPPSSVSPHASQVAPVMESPETSQPAGRALPSRNVTAGSIADAYVAFILYCNPHFAPYVDTEALRANFKNPPRSDNKDFETYKLYELIQKFDAKEIKTWRQLALDLGVEAPDVSKGQSVQKVQQYSVRLKRWMHAMHIDAFFEYLLGKQHTYFTDIPPADDPYPAAGRDGVLAEDDLAVRALDPSFRPKRGRRRNSETDQDAEGEVVEPPGKQPRVDGPHSSRHALSAYPASAHPDGYNDPWAMASAVTSQSLAPWASKPDAPQTAVTATAPSHLRWQLHGSAQNVATPHPMTAQPTSMAAHIEAAFDADDAKKHARRRRKHGPAVSSAWLSAKFPRAKPRGRPPSNRHLQDGPFGTFPADPANEGSSTPAKAATPEPPSISEVDSELPLMPPPMTRRQSEGLSRPGKLSLRVPQHTGGPVRLATPPPPRLLVNGECNDSESRSTTLTPSGEMPARQPAPIQRVAGNMQLTDRDIPGFAFETLKRVLTSDLLRAEIVGRQQRLNLDETKRLADAVLQRLGVTRQDTDDSRDDVARLTAASWLGLGEQLNVPLGPATSQTKCITVTRFRGHTDGYEEIMSANEDADESTREVFDLSWTVSMAGCNGSFSVKGITLNGPPASFEDAHDTLLEKFIAFSKQLDSSDDNALERAMVDAGGTRSHSNDGIDWKARYKALEFGASLAKGEMMRLKDRLVERLFDAII